MSRTPGAHRRRYPASWRKHHHKSHLGRTTWRGHRKRSIRDDQHAHPKIPELPRGLPNPEQTPTQVLVYIEMKQWRKVAEAIQQPDDVLIIKGFGIYEPAIKGIVRIARMFDRVVSKGWPR
ncbi:MAG: hypothetical protein H0X24_05320 [Ktedonobacterales bacterium]|nr:hypothetical protein [Ktedonobacterales bacterium]